MRFLRRGSGTSRLVLLVLALVLIYAINKLPRQFLGEPPAGEVASPEEVAAGEATILNGFRERRSGFVVESAGTVDRILAEDTQGDRHQRFILRLGSGHTLLMSHNIDLAPRVPVAIGDTVQFRGRYIWNEQGGVIHWTHRDPRGLRPGGWIHHRGTRYR